MAIVLMSVKHFHQLPLKQVAKQFRDCLQQQGKNPKHIIDNEVGCIKQACELYRQASPLRMLIWQNRD